VNVLWGFANLVIAYLLLGQVGTFELKRWRHALVAGAGALAMAVMLARHFGRFHGGLSSAGHSDAALWRALRPDRRPLEHLRTTTTLSFRPGAGRAPRPRAPGDRAAWGAGTLQAARSVRMRSPHDSPLDPRIRLRAALRCEGVGRLDWADDTSSGARLAVRWLPIEAMGLEAVLACQGLPLHAHLPRVLQTGYVGASAFVAVEYPAGELLSAVLASSPALEPGLVLRLGAGLASALAAVHARGLVHGELSLDSVLLAPDEQSFLWDLPLVVAGRCTERRTEDHRMVLLVRTAAFLAPECARGGAASSAADVFALGAILCLAAGCPRPRDTGTLGVVHQVATASWAPVAPAGLREPWRSVLQRMVAAEAGARPTASEVAHALADVPRRGAAAEGTARFEATTKVLTLALAPAVYQEVMQVDSGELLPVGLEEGELPLEAAPERLALPPPLPPSLARWAPSSSSSATLAPAGTLPWPAEAPQSPPALLVPPRSARRWGYVAAGALSAGLAAALATYLALDTFLPDGFDFDDTSPTVDVARSASPPRRLEHAPLPPDRGGPPLRPSSFP
jgi:serine/threonine protein kinase